MARRVLMLIVAAGFSIATTSFAAAQERLSTPDVIRANLEPSYLVVPINLSGLDPVWYEANILAHFFAHQESWPFALVLTPKIVLRLFREPSDPVKTPSYMPRLAFFLWSKDADDHGRRTRYASLTIGHHSNGQADPTWLAGQHINHDSGDFYTNYIELAGHELDRDRRWLSWNRLSLQWHPRFVQHATLHGHYGSLRAEIDSTILDNLPLRGRLGASVGVILDGFVRSSDDSIVRQLERFPVSVTYSVGFAGVEVALFARYYLGHDYYNIWFDRMLHTVQIGIASNVSPLLGSQQNP